MAKNVITDVSQLNATWLTEVLTKSGALLSGRVAGFTLAKDQSNTSHIARIEVTYQDAATGTLPTKLLLKLCANADFTGNPSEVNYYTRDYLGIAGLPIVKCYDAAHSPELGRYHLLLDDLSETHRVNWDVTPTVEFGLALADACAALHVPWWDVDKLAATGEPIPNAAKLENYIAHNHPGFAPLMEAAKDELQAGWPDALLQIFERNPTRMLERTCNPQGFTLVHGDANPGNTLTAKNGVKPLYLIDRQPFDWSLTTWLGVSDLAYAIVLWWDSDLRRQYEVPVLRRYHETLLARGITGYSWEQLWNDYRLCVVQCSYIPMNWCILEEERVNMRWLWLMELKRVITAYFDLNCAEIL